MAKVDLELVDNDGVALRDPKAWEACQRRRAVEGARKERRANTRAAIRTQRRALGGLRHSSARLGKWMGREALDGRPAVVEILRELLWFRRRAPRIGRLLKALKLASDAHGPNVQEGVEMFLREVADVRMQRLYAAKRKAEREARARG